ncbi:MAG: carbohydrate ABC transporter permease [Clostridia bacterium]|nr:carbohydrate ABC transporter permease [Clostridia bacterium]
MDTQTNSTARITKETKNKIHIEFEGRTSFKDRLIMKLTSTSFWIDKVWYLCRFILMFGISFVILSPFLSKILRSFMAKEDFVDATVSMIPLHWTTDIYKALIQDNGYFTAMLNTALLSLICALIQTFVCCMIGYGLAKFKFKGNKLVFLFVIITMAIPHSTLKLSLMQHFSNFDLFTVQSWGYKGILELINGGAVQLTGTFWPLIIMSLAGIGFKNGLYIFMMVSFFKGVPDELEESAYVDGCNTFRTFLQIILPTAVPMMITIFLFAFSWQWTDEFYSTLFFTGNINKTLLLPDVFRTIPESLVTSYAGQAMYYSAIRNTAGLLIIAPLVIMYLFCQRYLVQGIERSGIVG